MKNPFEEEPTEISPEEEENPEEEARLTELIESSESEEDLYAAIREIGGIKGTRREYDADELIDRIQKVKSGALGPSFITRTYGIRKKVMEIFEIEGQ